MFVANMLILLSIDYKLKKVQNFDLKTNTLCTMLNYTIPSLAFPIDTMHTLFVQGAVQYCLS